MKSKKKILIYIIFIALFALLVNKGCSTKIPPDKELIDNFIKHEQDFKKLVKMFMEDENTFDVDKRYDSKSISKEKYEKYMKIFDKINVYRIGNLGPVKNESGISISYDYYQVTGDYKGYSLYFKIPKFHEYRKLVNNIDKYHGTDNTNVSRHLKGNWYINYSASY